METPCSYNASGKRAAPEDTTNQHRTKSPKTQSPERNEESIFLKTLPRELRDEIYDYVAASETDIGLHITLRDDSLSEENSSPQSYAYSNKGLSHTCRQLRQEYSLRLQHRVEPLLAEVKITGVFPKPPKISRIRILTMRDRIRRHWERISKPPTPALDKSARSHVLRVADHKISRGVYLQEDVSYTMSIPFGGQRLSTLTATFASSAPRAYNNIYRLDASEDEGGLWKEKGHYQMLVQAAVTLLRLLKKTNWTDHEHLNELFWHYDIIFPRMSEEHTGGLTGRSKKDIWWRTLAGNFDYV